MTTPDEKVSRMNWRWPAAKGNNWLPWYVILRRLSCAMPMCILAVLIFIVTAIGWGLCDAKRIWKEFF